MPDTGAKVHVAAVDAVDHGAQLGAFYLGESAMLRPADEGESLPGQHRVGMAGPGFDGDDLDRHVLKQVLRHADVERQITGAVNGLGNQDFLGFGVGHVGAGKQRRSGRSA